MSERKKIESFDDIEAWKEARVLVSMVYESTGKEPFNKINYRHRLTQMIRINTIKLK
jgi:hypothetical protein